MTHTCCNHSQQTQNQGYAVHDVKCDNKNVSGQKVSTSDQRGSNSGDGASGDSSGDDEEGDCCHSGLSTSTISPHQHNHTDMRYQKRYTITGMDCPSCALSIEKSLSGNQDIHSTKLAYETGKLTVEALKQSTFETVMPLVEKLGYGIYPDESKYKERVYTIVGMDCSSCAESIEKHIRSLSTVKDATIRFASGLLTVNHERSTDHIIKEIEKLGYGASLKSTLNEPEKNRPVMDGYVPSVLSGILIASGFALGFTSAPTYLEIILFAIAIIISGAKPMKSAWYALKSKSLDMNVLMSSAAIGAVLIGEWFEGATVVFLFSLGTALQTSSMEKTRNSIRGLMGLAPSEAWINVDGNLVKKAAEDIEIGETIVIKPGDRIPLDGEITSGFTSINQAPITGESIPVDKTAGDPVFAGTINESGSIEVHVTKHTEDTAIARIIHQVEEAQEQRAPAQAFIDRFAHYYTPVVFVIALGLIVIPPILGLGGWYEWIYRGLALLIVACPCALVISTPVAIVSAIGNAARNGVLIKGGTFLERAGVIDAIVFDKTGTLTEGKPEVSSIKPIGMTENELLSIAYTLEDYSTHPIARTIVQYGQKKEITAANGSGFTNLPGKGVKATIQETEYYAGSLKFFDDLDVDLSQYREQILSLQGEGYTVVIIGTVSHIAGIITVADTIRNTTVNALQKLKGIGVRQLAMLTGDNEGTAKKIAEQTSINRYFAELMPEDKVSAIKKLQKEGHHVAMVGDGINDAPALATSDIGIAMGGAGTDTAMESADIVLLADNLENLPYTMKLSRGALNIIKQNIWFSILIKLAALALIVPGWLTLWMAVLSDTGAAVIVVLNALRLLRVKDKQKTKQKVKHEGTLRLG